MALLLFGKPGLPARCLSDFSQTAMTFVTFSYFYEPLETFSEIFYKFVADNKDFTHMKNITKFVSTLLLGTLGLGTAQATEANRGLWACKDGNVFVSWRMRATDSPKTTTYNLYADGKLVFSSKDRTNTTLPMNQYENSTFSLEVLNKAGEVIDSQSGIKADAYPYHHIKLNHPGNYTLPDKDKTVVTYHPYDCSAYDMDGDGEEEIIMVWSAGEGATAAATAPPILDCLKLDGRLVWRVNLGPNILSGCRLSFLCYDFDGDGYGELITKTAPGTKDGKGNFLSKGSAAGSNPYHSSINSSGVITDGGPEWITCFDGRSGSELATIDYWPLFNIQSDWDDRPNNTDGNTYGHRGNWLKGCVAVLDVKGKAKPCAVTVRGIYTYSYAAAYTWDGKNLGNVWMHTSDKQGQGIYGEGAHSVTCGDVDGDGFDEIIVGAACLDHDGKLKWRTGLGHGDATHLGEFNPENPGLEYFMITEETSSIYDCALLDAATGKVLMSKKQTGGDTGRGLIMDCDSTYDGAEAFEWSNAKMFTCKGVEFADWHTGSTNSSSINGRIFWDGDLLEEYVDRGHVDKWDNVNKTWARQYTYGYNIMVNGTKVQWGANTNNATKYNPCLQSDILGDWREESVFWTELNGQYYLTVYTTTMPSPYKLPWLRDDHTYDMAVAWEHCGYNQPPHLGYSPVEYYKSLRNMAEPTLTKHGGGSSKQTVNVNEPITDYFLTWDAANTVNIAWEPNAPEGIDIRIDKNSKNIYFSGTPKVGGMYSWTVTTESDADTEAVYTGYIEVKVPTDLASVNANRQAAYPNPTSGDLFITDSEGNLYNGKVTVCDALGRVVMEKVVSNGYLNLAPLSSDIYNVNVENANYKIMVK